MVTHLGKDTSKRDRIAYRTSSFTLVDIAVELAEELIDRVGSSTVLCKAQVVEEHSQVVHGEKRVGMPVAKHLRSTAGSA